MRCKLAVPFNLVQHSGGIAGLDAYFWNSVEHSQRRVLMILPLSALDNLPNGVILEPQVSVRDQLEDVKSIAEGRIQIQKKKERGLRLFSLRLASLFTPGRHVPEELRRELDMTDVFGYKIARSIARRIVDSSPLGGLAYLNVEIVKALNKIRLETRSDPVKRIYNRLLENDREFKKALNHALKKYCKELL